MANKNIAIISGPFLSAHLLLVRVIPALLKMGLNVHCFMVPMPQRKKPASPSIKRFRFYEYDLLANHIYPYLNTKTSVIGKLKTLDHILSLEGVKRYAASNVNGDEIENTLRRIPLIGTLSLHNPQVLNNKTIFFLKEKGFLWNLHRGLLPDYRGLYVPFWAKVNGQQFHGITLHDLVQKIDEGDIIDSRRVTLHPQNSILECLIDLVAPGTEIVLEAVKKYLLTGRSSMTPQNRDQGFYFSIPNEEEIILAQKKGIKLLGSPVENLALYQKIFGDSEDLKEVIISSIVDFERSRTSFAKSKEAWNNVAKKVSL